VSHLAARLAVLFAPDAGNGGGSTVTDSGADDTETTSTVTEGETKEASGETTEAAGETRDAKTETKDAKVDEKAAAAAIEKAAAALDLKLPKDFDAKHPTVAAVKKLGAELGLDSAKTQKLFDAHHQAIAATTKETREAAEKAGAEWLANQRKEWRGALEKDPEFGGAKWPETKAAVSRAYNHFGAKDPELKAFLDDGAGDHPAVVKFLARIGRAMAEDNSALKSKPKNGAASSADAELRKLFPNSKELFT